MGRSQFIRNLEEICKNNSVANVRDLKRGADEDITFNYTTGIGGHGEQIPCTIMFPSLDEYPDAYPVFIYSDSESIPKAVVDGLSKITYADVPLKRLLEKVVEVIGSKTPSSRTVDEDGDLDMDMDDDFGSDQDEEEEEEEEDDYDDDDGWGDDDLFSTTAKTAGQKFTPSVPAPQVSPSKVKDDLLRTKKAGFRVGVYGTPHMPHFTVCVSIKLSKLGLSEEALDAWEVDGQNYLILLIRYTDAYRDTPSLMGVRHAVTYRVGVSKSPKPLTTDIAGIFTSQIDSVKEGITSYQNFFLSHSLNRLMENFPQLLQYRIEKGFTWDEAELHFEELLRHEQSFSMANAETIQVNGAVPVSSENMPSIVRDDALRDIKVIDTRRRCAMPLLAMQFLIRRLVHCTKFCTICHKRIDADFSALLPYVCSNDLCLFQHINIAHDDIVERNLLTKASVVDLLVSFCYSSTVNMTLSTLPRGLNIHVLNQQGYHCAILWERNTITLRNFPDNVTRGLFKEGTWVCINTTIPETSTSKAVPFTIHAIIKDTMRFPVIELSQPLYVASHVNCVARAVGGNLQDSHMFPLYTVKLQSEMYGTFHLSNQLLDEVQDLTVARNALGQIMRTMPSIDEMVDRVRSGKPLNQWDRMIPQAYKLLRWIIASNRSHLVPVQQYELVTEESPQIHNGLGVTYHQFKWAMGSPDKEEALSKSIVKELGRSALYPTIFAYHGSPIANWHSIVREGLHFKSVMHGRAYGDGIYHAMDINTSLGYCGQNIMYGTHQIAYPGWEAPKDVAIWPGSILRPTTAISLNEIVNAPEKFRSKTPYLVVQHVEWVQTRYLFVAGQSKPPGYANAQGQSGASDTVAKAASAVKSFFTHNDSKSQKLYVPLDQCPNYTPKSGNSRLVLHLAPYFERNKLSSDGKSTLSSINLDSDSEDSDGELTTFINKLEPKNIPNVPRAPLPPRKVTPFDPAKTDRSRLVFLPPPSTASPMTSKALSKELASIMNIQHTTSPEELGWYIDGHAVENVYQWIVELHSFPLELPLAQDLMKANIQSVILEIRFGKTYPMSPPFVRVVSPRFLPFMQGGGGHVTAGGAICMELLTNSGWSAVSSIESVLLQVKLAIESTEPKPARLERGGERGIYGPQEAKEAYIRACRTHGWIIPQDIQDM